jgi:hypothetical protein
MGIEALYRRPRTTKPEPGHKILPWRDEELYSQNLDVLTEEQCGRLSAAKIAVITSLLSEG